MLLSSRLKNEADGVTKELRRRGIETHQVDEVSQMIGWRNAMLEIMSMLGIKQEFDPREIHAAEQALVAEYERWERHHCPRCGRMHAPEVF